MALSVSHRGKVIVHPGAEVYVDLTGMVQPGVDVSNVAAVIGEAPYGEPGVVHVFSEVEAAKQYFGEGSDIADGMYVMSNASNDSRVDDEPSLIYAYKANTSTQAEYWTTRPAYNASTGALLSGTVAAAAAKSGTTNAYLDFPGNFDEDLFKNLIVEITAGQGKGQQRQIKSSIDNGGNHRLSLRDDLDWTVVPFNGALTTTAQIRAPIHKLQASEWGTKGLKNKVEFGISSSNQSYQLQATYDTKTEAGPQVSGGPDGAPIYLKFDPTGGGTVTQWTVSTNWHVPLGTNASGTTTVASATDLDGADGVMPVDADGGGDGDIRDMKDRWCLITGTTQTNDSQHDGLLGKMFKVRNNIADTVNLYSPGLGFTPTNIGLKWAVLQITDVYVKVTGKNGVSETLKIFMKDALIHDTELASIDLTKLSSMDALVQELNDVPGITATLGDGVSGNLLPSRFDFGPWSEHYGYQEIGILGATASIGDSTLSLDKTGGWQGGAGFTDPGGNYDYPIIIGRGTSSEEILRVSDVTIGVPDTLSLTTTLVHGFTIPGVHVIERIVHGQPVSLDSDWTLATPAGSDDRVYQQGSNLIRGPGDVNASGDSDPGEYLRDNVERMADEASNTFARFTVSRATDTTSSTYEDEVGAAQSIDMQGLYQRFYNGSEGTSSVSKPSESSSSYPISWEHGFEELLKYEDIRVVVPLASEDLTGWTTGDIDTLAVIFQDHLNDGEDNRAERQGYLGLKVPLEASTISGTTYSRGLVEWARFFNDSRLSLCGQTTKVFTSDGSEKVLDPWGFACQAAGIQLGQDVGEGLTFKFIRTSDLGYPFSDWDIRSKADYTKVLLGGILAGEPSRGRWRILRGLTTHIESSNLAQTDINVWAIRNLCKREIREMIEDEFIGGGVGNLAEGVRVAPVVTVATVRGAMDNLMSELKANGYIVESTDENGQPVEAWTGLSVKISGDILTIKVQVFPKTAINFALVDLAFQLPQISG